MNVESWAAPSLTTGVNVLVVPGFTPPSAAQPFTNWVARNGISKAMVGRCQTRLLQALAVRPELGRWFSAEDQDPHGPPRVILSDGYWRRRFGADRSVIGRNLMVDSRSREIVGVMPPGFRLANEDFEVIVPLALDRGKLPLAGFGINHKFR